MERLQAAIAKARAAREARGDAPRGAPPPQGSVNGALSSHAQADATPIPASADKAWADLREIQVSEKLLVDNRIVSTIGRNREAMEFDRLRTRVVQRMQQNGWTRLAITSPGPGCGKSTITLNLGFGLARQEGSRVMVLEMDMRRPSMARILGAGAGRDLSRVIAGDAAPGEHLVRARDNLAIGISEPVTDSAELLQSATAATAIDQIATLYQPSIMLFDMPPFRVSDDVLSFAGKVDCVLIVAAAGQTSMDELDECERELSAQTPILGVVLNKCRFSDRDEPYYYN